MRARLLCPWLIAAFFFMTAVRAVGAQTDRPIVVATKPFAESFILGEIFAQLLEARGFAVERRPGLGATQIAFDALRRGDIDVYPEYTGTGLLAILGEDPPPTGAEAYRRVTEAFRARWGVRWLPPLGFESTVVLLQKTRPAAVP